PAGNETGRTGDFSACKAADGIRNALAILADGIRRGSLKVISVEINRCAVKVVLRHTAQPDSRTIVGNEIFMVKRMAEGQIIAIAARGGDEFDDAPRSLCQRDGVERKCVRQCGAGYFLETILRRV